MSRKLFSLLILVTMVASVLPAVVVAAPPPQAGGTVYTVQKDDWLSKLADKEYGDVLAYEAIVYYNNLKAAEDESFNYIANPDRIEVGWTIYIPTAEEAAAYLAGELAVPTQYNEAPMLAEMVAKGELPPVEERLPENPLVVDVVDDIGQYGGVWRRGFLGPADANNYVRVAFDGLVRYAPDGSMVVPQVVESWQASDGFKTWTLYLRKGAKWSDGAPFSADDIMFWYEDVFLNKDLTPVPHPWLANEDGSIAVVEKVDDYTVRYRFKQPNTAFLLELANKDGGDRLLAAFQPAHYLKQFHPNYVSEDALQALVKDAGFETWTELFNNKALPPDNAERPTMAAWVPYESTVADPVFVLRRNPYYIGVDRAGNQLPYIDEIRFTFFADKQALNLAATAGELDLQARHIDMTNYPVFIENQEKGGYRVVTWPTFGGSDAAVTFNQTYEKDPAIGDLLRNKDFRIALSYAISRDEIREAAFLGLGQARQPVPAPWHPFYPGDEWAFKYTEYDPDEANELLDSIGLDKKDSEGFRLLPDGNRLTLEISVVPAFGPWPDVAQLVGQAWEAVGVKTIVQIRERSLHFQMRDTNDLITEVWNNDTTGFPFSGEPQMDPRSLTAVTLAPLHRKWYETGGKEGMEPPAEINRLVEIIDKAKTVGSAEQTELAQELFKVWADNAWQIGTVGLTPMIQGVVIVNKDLYNVPETLGNDWPLRTPGNARPEQFFFKR